MRKDTLEEIDNNTTHNDDEGREQDDHSQEGLGDVKRNRDSSCSLFVRESKTSRTHSAFTNPLGLASGFDLFTKSTRCNSSRTTL
jgi:hypothetical protein